MMYTPPELGLVGRPLAAASMGHISIQCGGSPTDLVPAESEAAAPATPAAPAAPAADAPVALLDERHQRLRQMIREVRAEIMAKSDDVGRSFPAEARKIHDGEAPPRSIYGQASGEEIQELLEDGIAILPMPGLPEERN